MGKIETTIHVNGGPQKFSHYEQRLLRGPTTTVSERDPATGKLVLSITDMTWFNVVVSVLKNDPDLGFIKEFHAEDKEEEKQARMCLNEHGNAEQFKQRN